MSNLIQRATARQRAVIVAPSFSDRLGRPWFEDSKNSPVVAQAERDYAARKKLGLSLRDRAPALIEALA